MILKSYILRVNPVWKWLNITVHVHTNWTVALSDHGPEVQIPVQILILKTKTIGPLVNSLKILASS